MIMTDNVWMYVFKDAFTYAQRREHTHTNATLFHAPIDAHECTETYSEMEGRMDRLAAKQLQLTYW
jgi:hypothetical protein